MINLPHTLDLVEIVSSIGGSDDGYVFNTKTNNPILSAGEYYLYPNRTAVRIHLTDSEGSVISTDLLGMGRVVLMDSDDAFDHELFILGANAAGERESDASQVVYLDIAIGSNDVIAGNFIPVFSGALRVIFATEVIAETILTGRFNSAINCLVSPLSRSLDENYQSRYLIVTDYQINHDIRNLYLFKSGKASSGLLDDVSGVKVERVQSFGAVTNITGLVYPTDTLDRALDLLKVNYNKDNQTVTTVLPQVENEA